MNLFTLKIDGCRFLTNHRFRDSKAVFANGTYNAKQAAELPCIHQIFMRDRGLPFYRANETDSIVTGNANSSYSRVEELPWTDAYYYLLIVTESRVEYNITISVEGIEKIDICPKSFIR